MAAGEGGQQPRSAMASSIHGGGGGSSQSRLLGRPGSIDVGVPTAHSARPCFPGSVLSSPPDLGSALTASTGNGGLYQLFKDDIPGVSYQALLQNVSCTAPSTGTDLLYFDHTAGTCGNQFVNCAGVANCDIGIDESGYESSGSSKYDVNSDDELCLDLDSGNNLDNDGDFNIVSVSGFCNDGANRDGDAGAVSLEECPCLSGNPFMHVMTEVTEQPSGTWKKRKPSVPGRPDCRVPKGMGAIEIALRNAPYRQTKYIFEPLLGLTFDSEEEAYQFYNMYSWEVGFGIKKKGIANNNKARNLTKRDYRCLCADKPDGIKYNSKKTGCKAMLRLLRTDDDAWYIKQHVAEHNHPLTESCGQTKEWFSHGRIDGRAMDLIKYLRENNVSLTKVHCIMGSVYGSMDKVPITKRSLRTICHQIAKDQMDDDVQKTLKVFQQIRKKDADFQFSVDTDSENKIKTLLWINGRSRDQYKCFGDVITFDTTYCTNIYKMPFGLFVGVNNHFQTTIFGGVFMKDETIPSFEWVFREFVSLMGGELPKTVFTDQCAAMAAALAVAWQGTIHLLCKWHVLKDAPSRLGPIYKKGSKFRKLFHKIINDMLTIDEFERAWYFMLNRYDLVNNEYLADLYDKRKQWAKPFFKDTFCARMSSTQRSESANHMLKTFVPRNCSMNRFIIQFNKLLFARNSAEDRAEFETKIEHDVRERAWPFEIHATKFYTKAVYALFRKEVNKSTNYFAVEKEANKMYEVVHVKPGQKLPWDREKMTVMILDNGERYDCECGLYQHFGVLCSHVLRVMVQLGVSEVPKAHINKRWTVSARDILPAALQSYQKENLCLDSMTYRHSYLYVNAIGVVEDGNKDLGAFEIVSKSLKKIQRKLKTYFLSKEKSAQAGGASGHMLFEPSYYTTESDAGFDSGTDTERRLCNTFGAAGSSAGLSDSELMRIKAPSFNRPAGRPRQVRLKGALDYFDKRKSRKQSSKLRSKMVGTSDCEHDDNSKKRKIQIRCGGCNILGHNITQCKKKRIDVETNLPEF